MKTENEFNFANVRARITLVKICGLQRTSDDYVKHAVKPLFSCHNFKDLITETNVTRNRLLELGIFKNVNAFIDICKNNDNCYEVTFNANELKKVTGSVGTEIAPQEGCFVTELAAPNLFGRGEKLTLNGSYSNLRTSDLMLKLFKPLYHTSIGHLKPDISVNLFRHATIFDWSKFRLEQLGVSFYGSIMFPKRIHHSLRCGTYMRDMIAFKTSPLLIREYCGPSLGNLINYTISIDSRNSVIFASEGFFIKNTIEILDNTLKHFGHLKNELHLEYNHLLWSEISLQMCIRIGKIISSSKNDKMSIADFFFIGGPQTLRGFCFAGVNKHESTVSLGAKSYWICNIHLWSKLPYSHHLGHFSNLLRLQLFYNMGSVNNFNFENYHSSVGAGLALRLGDKARIELNYCVPLRYQDQSFIKKFQFGIGYDFL